ncbi:MAG: hypothetical protein SOX89_01220, partial [Treponema sp.]|nr:hypothetical protein [Treponema sp.]
EKVLKAKIPEDTWRSFMTLEQEVKLAAKHAAEKAAKEAYEKAEMKGVKEKLDSARNFKESGVSLEIISKCTGLSLEQIQNL